MLELDLCLSAQIPSFQIAFGMAQRGSGESLKQWSAAIQKCVSQSQRFRGKEPACRSLAQTRGQ